MLRFAVFLALLAIAEACSTPIVAVKGPPGYPGMPGDQGPHGDIPSWGKVSGTNAPSKRSIPNNEELMSTITLELMERNVISVEREAQKVTLQLLAKLKAGEADPVRDALRKFTRIVVHDDRVLVESRFRAPTADCLRWATALTSERLAVPGHAINVKCV